MIALSVAAIFAALFILVLMAWPGQQVSKSRLGIERQPLNVGRSMNDFLERHGKRQGIAQALALADIDIDPGQFVMRVLVASVLTGVLGLLVSPIIALVGLVVPYLLVRSWVSRKGHKRQEAFAAQLGDTLQLLVSSLRSGFGLLQALDAVAQEAEEPMRSEVERTLAETRMGRDLSSALRSLAQRMDSADLEWVISAIDIGRETGGNLSEIMGNVATTIRERQKLQRKVRTYTAEGRLTARVLTLLPLAMFVWQWQTNKNFDVLLHGGGLLILVGCGALMLVGWLWIKRIVAIKIKDPTMIIIYGAAIGAAILALVWGLTAKAPAARANLFAGLDLPQQEKQSVNVMGSVGSGVRRFLPTSYIDHLDTLLVQAAHPWRLDRSRLLGVKVALTLIIAMLGFALGYSLYGAALAAGAFFLPDLLVMTKRDERREQIRLSAADIIDQLTICVEAGLGFDAAFTRVGQTNDGPLAAELLRAVEDMRAGLSRDQALRGMAERSQIPEIKQLVTALVQAQKHGVPMAETLRIQSSEWRDKRQQGLEEKAAKLSTKMLFPIVFCFLPVFFVLIVVPAISGLFHNLPH